MRKNSISVLGIGIVVVALLLSFTPSWGDTRLMVDQAATTGIVTLTVWDGALKTASVTNAPPMSCDVPVVEWDSTVAPTGGWVIFGFDKNGLMWAGAVTCASYNPAVTPCTYTNKTGTVPSDCTGFTIASSCLVSSAPLAATVAVSPVNGSCGSNNNGTFSSTPPLSGLCSAGSVTIFTGTGPWSWNCVGSNGGTTAYCSANLSGPPVNGSCGSSNGGTFSTKPTTGFCNGGTASSVSGTGPWNWTCYGLNGGSNANCSAMYGTAAVNGACGSSNGQTLSSAPTTGLCSAGTANGVSGTGPWTWSCTGSNGGSNANCTAYTSAGPSSPIPLTFNGGTMSKKDTLQPGAEKIYVFTVPASPTYFQANYSSVDQGTNLNILVEQGTYTNIDSYYADAYSWYAVNSKWGNAYMKTYPPTVWAKMSGVLSGEGITVRQSTASPATDTPTTAAVLPGTYYLLVKNSSTCPTCVATYYVYVQGY